MYSKYLEGLQPRRVFEIFDQLCYIPHGSWNEKAISDYAKEFCLNLGLETYQDEFHNLIIKKPATKGYENVPIVVLQAHLDMVCQRKPDSTHDFERDPIEVLRKGDSIYAKDTTLGADDGTGVAFALSVLESTNLKHPQLEVVLTSNEEAGMTGIKNLDFDRIKGRVILNLDCSDEGIVVGCAGTLVSCTSFSFERIPLVLDRGVCSITVSGLQGGHAGLMAIQEGGNANALLARVLSRIFEVIPFGLVSFDGGLLDNAITRASTCVVSLPNQKIPECIQLISEYEKLLQKEYAMKDDGITLSTEELVSCEESPMSDEDTEKFLSLINVFPNGLLSTSKDVKNLAELSANMGVVHTKSGTIEIHTMCRARYDSGKQHYLIKVKQLAKLANATVTVLSEAPEWEYKPASRLSNLINEIYNQEYGKDILVEISHGGNECGNFFRHFPDADIVCSGTKITGAHTTEETVAVSVIQKEWKMLCRTLEGMLNY
ncbi:beta-Ala-His dipeptidase [uncultured Sphaerochaeta sp.]|uniref:beta-Ala-His dipeptidase n=1 Tax=uncultured Sphaerochaeta sp. TaxID=886478 RepID=UPI002A0A7776|nr:beta-Ala-His dipeptidase [uncultured Sphaerochaeta sp.]